MGSYHKGRRFEYKVRDYIKKIASEKDLDVLVIRCARSKPYDLVVLSKNTPPILVECKSHERYSREEIRRKEEEAKKYGCMFLLVTPRTISRIDDLFMGDTHA